MSRLHFRLTGRQGPVLVLLHAFPLDGSMWNAQAQALSKKARVLVPDLPGFGGSKSARASSMADMAKAVVKLLDHLSIKEPVVIAGLSMGGYVAFEFIRLFPKRVRAIGLFATRAGADSPEGRKKRYEQVKNVRSKGAKPLTRAMAQKLLGGTSLKRRTGTVRSLKRMLLEAKPAGITNALLAMAKRRNNEDILKNISRRALIVAGKEDGVIPLDEMRILHKKIGHSTFRILPRAGHLLNLEEPRALNTLLRKFLSRV